MKINLLDIQSNTMGNLEPGQLTLDVFGIGPNISNYNIFSHLGPERTDGRKRISPLMSIDSNVVKTPLKRKHSRDPPLPLSQKCLEKENERIQSEKKQEWCIMTNKNALEELDGRPILCKVELNGDIVGGFGNLQTVRA